MQVLSALEPGRQAIVTDVFTKSISNSRLQELGLVRGTNVLCVYKSPLGDPSAFLIRGAVIAIRTEDSSLVQINEVTV